MFTQWAVGLLLGLKEKRVREKGAIILLSKGGRNKRESVGGGEKQPKTAFTWPVAKWGKRVWMALTSQGERGLEKANCCVTLICLKWHKQRPKQLQNQTNEESWELGPFLWESHVCLRVKTMLTFPNRTGQTLKDQGLFCSGRPPKWLSSLESNDPWRKDGTCYIETGKKREALRYRGEEMGSFWREIEVRLSRQKKEREQWWMAEVACCTLFWFPFLLFLFSLFTEAERDLHLWRRGRRRPFRVACFAQEIRAPLFAASFFLFSTALSLGCERKEDSLFSCVTREKVFFFRCGIRQIPPECF